MLDEKLDLSFRSASLAAARTLSADQIARYNSQGFVQP